MRSKTNIELSKWHVVSFVLFIIGFILLSYGLNACYKMRASANISRIKTEKLRKGQYVKGEIKKYIGKNIETVNGDIFNGVSESNAYGFTFYDAYTIPTADDKYAVVYIKDEDILEKLESYDLGQGKGVYFVGKVEKARYKPNYEYWDNTGIFGSREEAEDKIFSKYVIREINYEKRKHRMYEGLMVIMAAWIIFKIGGRIKIR